MIILILTSKTLCFKCIFWTNRAFRNKRSAKVCRVSRAEHARCSLVMILHDTNAKEKVNANAKTDKAEISSVKMVPAYKMLKLFGQASTFSSRSFT